MRALVKVVLLLLAGRAAGGGCKCAPLASCVVHPNGSLGCYCPFFGDGVEVCEEQRFTTEAAVRYRDGGVLQGWLGWLGGGSKVAAMHARALQGTGLTQAVLELDSTDYDAMEALTARINGGKWPLEVALLGSATSVVVDGAGPGVALEAVVRLEVVNLTYVNGRWGVEVAWEVGGGLAGALFVAADASPVPCVDARRGDRCCVQDLGRRPFAVGNSVAAEAAANCTVGRGLGSQSLGAWSEVEVHADGWGTVWLNPLDLEALARVGVDGDANFSVGVVGVGAFPAVAQTEIALRRSGGGQAVGTFTRQVAEHVLLQVEAVGAVAYARLWALLSLENATVIEARYAWGPWGAGVAWVAPECGGPLPACLAAEGVACYAAARGKVLEAWVPLADWREGAGNLTLYVVVQRGATMARVLVQGEARVVGRRCGAAIATGVEVEVLQGLGLRSVVQGVQGLVEVPTDSQTDALLTIVARSGADELRLVELRALHARTMEDRDRLVAGLECVGCVAEQLVLNGTVTTPRSCHVLGSGDDLAWLEGYVGLVGSTLARDVLGRVPADVRLAPRAVVVAWVNPTWSWGGGDVDQDWTFLDMRFEVSAPAPMGRRLLASQRPLVSEPPLVANRRIRSRPVTWALVTVGAIGAVLGALWLAGF